MVGLVDTLSFGRDAETAGPAPCLAKHNRAGRVARTFRKANRGLWLLSIWVISCIALPAPLFADRIQDAHAFCQSLQADGVPACHLQPCPCAADAETLRRFEDESGTPALCACRSPLELRHQTRMRAIEVCDEFRRAQRQSCFISRGDCPRGFEAIADFSDRDGNRFTACRDSRHRQPGQTAPGMHGLTQEQLRNQYARFLENLDVRRVGQPRKLPQSTIDDLDSHFSPGLLESLSLITTRALSRGCFSDCGRIFCAIDGPVALWTASESPLISRNLIHQIIHADRCERIGAHDRFIDNWFRHLPDDIYRQMRANEPIDAKGIHAAMYMESLAKHRSESLCGRLPGCRME